MSSRASRANRDSARGHAKPRRAAAEAAQPAEAIARPANKKGVLAGHEAEIVRLYAGGKGRRLSSIARTFGVSHNAIRKCLGLPRRAANRLTTRVRLGGRRDATCSLCGGSIPNNGSATASACRVCVDKYFPTVWSRDRGDSLDTLPENLRRRYSLSG